MWKLGLMLMMAATPMWAEIPPVIKPFELNQNHFKTLESGMPFELNCDYESATTPEPEIAWFRDQQPLDEAAISGLEIDGNTLKFTDPEPSVHSGRYHCEAKNDYGLAKSEVIEVGANPPSYPEYQVSPVFTITPKPEIKSIQSDVTFKCAATGTPEPTIHWIKNGVEIKESWNQEYLTIESISKEDIGSYACNASNEVGYAYINFYLNILKQKPFFVEKPLNRQAAIGQEVFLRCHAKGYPKPTISWKFEGDFLDPESDENLEQDPRGDLIIRRVTNSSAGLYECIAENEIGEQATEGRLDVVSTTTIEKGPEDMVATIHETVEMNCKVLWDPSFELTVTWMFNNQPIDTSSSASRFFKNDDNSLIIRDLHFSDEGLYTCVAATSQGSQTDSGILTVLGIPPKLILGPEETQTIPEGATLELPCTVESEPKAEHVWFKDADRVDLTDPRFSVTEGGTLIIKSAKKSDSDKYICRASNNFEPDVIVSTFVDVRKSTKILDYAESQKYVQGANYSLECLIEVDPDLKDTVNVTWVKDGQAINLEDSDRFFIDSNFTLYISDVTAEEIGDYACQVQTEIDEIIIKASIYTEEFGWWWLIIIIIILIIIVLVCCIVTICSVRRSSRKKGRYGVKDVEDGKAGGKHNKSDIHYSIDDEGDDVENDLLKDDDKMTPIFKPNGKSKEKLGKSSKSQDSGLLLDDAAAMGGSENSLLNLTDEEIFLRKGMDEDGSFREGKYAD